MPGFYYDYFHRDWQKRETKQKNLPQKKTDTSRHRQGACCKQSRLPGKHKCSQALAVCMSWHTGPLPKQLILQSVQESACVKKKPTVYKTHQSSAEPSMKSPNAYSVRTFTLPATAAMTSFEALICCDIYTEIQHGLITHH